MFHYASCSALLNMHDKIVCKKNQICASMIKFIRHLNKIQFIKDLSLDKANKNTVGNRRADFPLAEGGLPGHRLGEGAFHPKISQTS